jgi:hypothetical protein
VTRPAPARPLAGAVGAGERVAGLFGAVGGDPVEAAARAPDRLMDGRPDGSPASST